MRLSLICSGTHLSIIFASFVSAAKVGTEITCEGRLLKLGRKLAYTQVDVYGEDGKLVATGRHTKAFA